MSSNCWPWLNQTPKSYHVFTFSASLTLDTEVNHQGLDITQDRCHLLFTAGLWSPLRYCILYWAVQMNLTCLSLSRQDRMCGHWGVMIRQPSAVADEVGMSSQNKLRSSSLLLHWQLRFTEQTTLHYQAHLQKHTHTVTDKSRLNILPVRLYIFIWN